MKLPLILATLLLVGCGNDGHQSGKFAVGNTSGHGSTGFDRGFNVYCIDGHRLRGNGTVIDPEIPLLGVILTFDPNTLTTDSYSVSSGVSAEGSDSSITVSHKRVVAEIKWDRRRDTLSHEGDQLDFSPGMIIHVHEATDGSVAIEVLDDTRLGVSDWHHLEKIALRLRESSRQTGANRVPVTDR
jgi:hypothetical protein